VNTFENKYCSKCSYPLVPDAFDEIEKTEDSKLQAIEQKHQEDMELLRNEMNQQFSQILSIIQQNPMLAYVKPDALVNKRFRSVI
jgi:integrase/recombinase XerD